MHLKAPLLFIFKSNLTVEIFIGETYEVMSAAAAEEIKSLTSAKTSPLICPASGSTPERLYKELTRMAACHEIAISEWNFVGLDEWAGLNEKDEGSCRQTLDVQLFNPLQIQQNKICFFDGKKGDLEPECVKVENFIKRNGGIDIAIVGLGLNGHVGMNEPGTDKNLRSHVTSIDLQTQQVGQKYFTTPKKLTHGITLGIANLMEARHVILMVSGTKKAPIVNRVLTASISEKLPATLLRNHPSLKIFLDKEAASEYQPS